MRKLPVKAKLPTTIKEHKYSWFWKPAWLRMHTKKQQFNAAFCAAPGSGKSYATLSAAELLDRGSDDVCRFDISRVAFSVQDFFELTNQHLPVGSAIILDDSALAALSSETLKREVRQLTKAFISMRHLRRAVFLNFPAITMLSSNILRTLMYYVEMRGIDEKAQQSIGAPMAMQTNPRSGKIYYHRPTFVVNRFRDDLGFTMPRTYIRPPLRFDLPSSQLVKDYEAKRKEEMRRFYEESKEIVEEKKGNKVSFQEDYDYVKAHRKQFLIKNKIDVVPLLIRGMSESRARMIARSLNNEFVKTIN